MAYLERARFDEWVVIEGGIAKVPNKYEEFRDNEMPTRAKSVRT